MNMTRDVRHVLLMPSFYGGTVWLLWLFLYWIRLIPWESTSGTTYVLCAALTAAYWLSVSLQASRFASATVHIVATRTRLGSSAQVILAVAHLVGFAGLAKYVFDFSNSLGGLDKFLTLLQESPHAIRWESEITSSIGTQISYVGWLATWITTTFVFTGGLRKRWLVLAAIGIAGNLMFIDRTRPIWILFTIACLTVTLIEHVTVRQLSLAFAGVIAGGVALFVALGLWSGKISEDNAFSGPGLSIELANVYAYGTSGFAYLNHAVETDRDFGYVPIRLLYPALKALSSVDLIDAPPSQVLAFRSVPYDTNVGTILEPFHSDGGLLFAFFGIWILSFGLDAVALYLWRQRSVLARIAAANLCFLSVIGFFTPKIASFPMWLFVGTGLCAAWATGHTLNASRTPTSRISR